jgi:5-methylcytosine-specific restriction enzyme A
MRVCNVPGCPRLVKAGRCPEHQKAYDQQRYRQDNERRGNAHARGYGSRWVKWRAGVIAEFRLIWCGDRPTGAPETTHSLCRADGRKTLGQTLDHIQRVSGPEDSRFFDETNCQLLCRDCDQRRRGRQAHEPSPPEDRGGHNYRIW